MAKTRLTAVMLRDQAALKGLVGIGLSVAARTMREAWTDDSAPGWVFVRTNSGDVVRVERSNVRAVVCAEDNEPGSAVVASPEALDSAGRDALREQLRAKRDAAKAAG